MASKYSSLPSKLLTILAILNLFNLHIFANKATDQFDYEVIDDGFVEIDDSTDQNQQQQHFRNTQKYKKINPQNHDLRHGHFDGHRLIFATNDGKLASYSIKSNLYQPNNLKLKNQEWIQNFQETGSRKAVGVDYDNYQNRISSENLLGNDDGDDASDEIKINALALNNAAASQINKYKHLSGNDQKFYQCDEHQFEHYKNVLQNHIETFSEKQLNDLINGKQASIIVTDPFQKSLSYKYLISKSLQSDFITLDAVTGEFCFRDRPYSCVGLLDPKKDKSQNRQLLTIQRKIQQIRFSVEDYYFRDILDQNSYTFKIQKYGENNEQLMSISDSDAHRPIITKKLSNEAIYGSKEFRSKYSFDFSNYFEDHRFEILQNDLGGNLQIQSADQIWVFTVVDEGQLNSRIVSTDGRFLLKEFDIQFLNHFLGQEKEEIENSTGENSADDESAKTDPLISLTHLQLVFLVLFSAIIGSLITYKLVVSYLQRVDDSKLITENKVIEKLIPEPLREAGQEISKQRSRSVSGNYSCGHLHSSANYTSNSSSNENSGGLTPTNTPKMMMNDNNFESGLRRRKSSNFKRLELETLNAEELNHSDQNIISSPIKITVNDATPTLYPSTPTKNQNQVTFDQEPQRSNSIVAPLPSADKAQLQQKRKRIISECPTGSLESRFEEEWTVTGVLGVGGFGIVFKAQGKLGQELRAIKRVRFMNKLTDKNRREVRLMATLRHNNIVQYHTSWTESPDLECQKRRDQGYYDTHIKDKGLHFGDDDQIRVEFGIEGDYMDFSYSQSHYDSRTRHSGSSSGSVVAPVLG